jgi:hypothetical protein
MLIGLLCCGVSFVCVVTWQKHVAQKVLAGPARGAEAFYYETSNAPARLGMLAARAFETRAPGSYLNILNKWTEAMAPNSHADEAAWVTKIRVAQHQQVVDLLAKYKTSPDQISSLQSKLEKISPQLTENETALLSEITSFSGVMDLADVEIKSSKMLFAKLHELGASDNGLAGAGLENWSRDLN